MTLPILARIDDALRNYEQSTVAIESTPAVARCRCSWCRRQGMTRAMPVVLPARAAPAVTGWRGLLRKR
jgi:hypothetical protein